MSVQPGKVMSTVEEVPYTEELLDRLSTAFKLNRAESVCVARLLAEHDVALVDRKRERFLIDERVYEGALFRAGHWRRLAEAREPVPMILFCPSCGARHIDAADPASGWTNPPHRSHLCGVCSYQWRPADVPTVGVDAIATRGENDCPTEHIARRSET